MPILFHFFLAIALTVLQVAFLSHLPTPFSDISAPLAAITIANFLDRPVRGALWALVGGIVLDLHGIYPFGTEVSVLLVVFFLTRLLFRRFITNAGLPASFLFSTAVVAMHAALLLALDGVRVIFGAEPFIVTLDSSILSATVRTIVANGLMVVLLIKGWSSVRERFINRFIIRR